MLSLKSSRPRRPPTASAQVAIASAAAVARACLERDVGARVPDTSFRHHIRTVRAGPQSRVAFAQNAANVCYVTLTSFRAGSFPCTMSPGSL